MTSIVLQISKIHLNYASPEPEPVLTHLSLHACIPGMQTCIPSPYISLTNTVYLPVMHSV